jgi:hypothetical protein
MKRTKKVDSNLSWQVLQVLINLTVARLIGMQDLVLDQDSDLAMAALYSMVDLS